MQVAGDLLDLHTDAADLTMVGTDGRVEDVVATAKGTHIVHQGLSVGWPVQPCTCCVQQMHQSLV